MNPNYLDNILSLLLFSPSLSSLSPSSPPALSLTPPHGIITEYQLSLHYPNIALVILSIITLVVLSYILIRYIKKISSLKKQNTQINIGLSYQQSIAQLDALKSDNLCDIPKDYNWYKIRFFQLRHTICELISHYTKKPFSALTREERIAFYQGYIDQFNDDFQDSLEQYLSSLDDLRYKQSANNNTNQDSLNNLSELYTSYINSSYAISKQLSHKFNVINK